MVDGRILALDLGDARIGVAISDQGQRLAMPLTTLTDIDPSALSATVERLLDEHHAAEVVVGYPLSMSGEPGPRAKAAAKIAAELRERLPVPVVLHDERLSTVEAQRRLSEAGVRGKDQRAIVDQAAAVIILESYLSGPR